jgi:glucose-1-phosphate thymidylyltransferase
MKSIILAAGYATRMFPLTKEFPKPLLKVGARPIIEYILDKLEEVQRIDEIIVVTNSKFIAQFNAWAAQQKSSKRITVMDDLTSSIEDRRGAIGDMHFAVEHGKLSDDVLVVGGDNVFDGTLEELLGVAGRQKLSPVIGVHDIGNKELASNYGVVEVDQDNKVVDFVEKPSRPASTLVAMCLYYFPKERLGMIDEYVRDKQNKSDAAGFYIDWLRKKVPVYACVFGGRWFDIGDPAFYKEAGEQFK